MDSVPFARAVAVTPVASKPASASASPGGVSCFHAELLRAWEADGAKQHGGVLLALATSAALAALNEPTLGSPGWQPLAVSAAFARAGSTGPADITTELLGDGPIDHREPGRGTAELAASRPVSVVRSTLRQDGEVLLDTTVTAGRLPTGTELPTRSAAGPLSRLSPAPPPELLARTGARPSGPPLASACEVVIDPSTTAYRRKERAEPAMRGWVRPKGEEPDVLFALFAGDILPTGLFNFGLVGWAPTVQLTALLRAAPVPGWLRVGTQTRTISGGWFDEDVTVLDAGGRLICQARQLARSPKPRTRT